MLGKKNFGTLLYLFLLVLIISSPPDIKSAEIDHKLLSAIGTQPPTFEIKQIGDINVPFQNGIPFPAWEKQDREYISLDGTWKSERRNVNHKLTLTKRTPEIIKLVEEESESRHKADYDDNLWNDKAIPGVENPAPDRYQDGVWYRRRFSLPAKAAGKYVKLMFESANYFTDVWVNGQWVGCHEGGYTPFAFDVTPFLNFGGENILAVRVDNIPWLPDADKSAEALRTNDHNIVPYKTCDWWNYGGITRHVYLELAPAVSVVRADIRSKILDDKTSELTVDATVYNYSQEEINASLSVKVLQTDIRDKNIEDEITKHIASSKKAVDIEGETSKNLILKPKEAKPVRFTFKSKDLKHWSPEEPNLYVLQVNLGDKKKKHDEFYTQFGIREIAVDKKNAKLLFNGKEVFLRGVARHEAFYGEPGPVEYGPKCTFNDLKIFKELNINFVRTSHYPNHQQNYILTDRLGFFVWEEIPVYWFEGPELEIQRKIRGIGRQFWLEMIYRDYNRPSIIIWSAVNENSYQKERADFIKDLRGHAYKIDGTRLVAQSAAGSDPTDATQKECDLIGFTLYYGVFYGQSYYTDTLAALKKCHAAFPDKPILSTEYGIWSPYGDLQMEDVQVEVAEENFKAFRELSYVCGATWWAGFDWHTMINEPETMGLMTMDRKNQKAVFFQIQRQYAALLGDLKISLKGPEESGLLSGKVKVTAQVEGKDEVEVVELLVDQKSRGRLSGKKGEYTLDFDTRQLSDGKYTLVARVKAKKGYYVSDFVRIAIDNIDEPPVLITNLKDNDAVMGKATLTVVASDDRSQPEVAYSIDGSEPQPMQHLGGGVFQQEWDISGLEDGSRHEVTFIATDSAKQKFEKKVDLIIDNKPGQYVALPFDHDWISWKSKLADGTGWDFPAEELPPSNLPFIFNGEERVKFMFGNKDDGAFNNVTCRKQTFEITPGRYTKVYILAAMHDGGGKGAFVLNYTDGTEEKVTLGFSDWWGGNPIFGEKLVVKTSNHHEATGERKPGVGIYLQTIEPDHNRILHSITLPAEKRLQIFAMTLQGETVNDPVPEPVILEPRANDSLGDLVKITVEEKSDDIVKVVYCIDSGTYQAMTASGAGIYTAEWDTAKVTGINHSINVKAVDKLNQVGTKTIDVRVVNKVTIIFPFDGASVYKSANIMVEPRANREVEKIEFQIDNRPFEKMDLSNTGLYVSEWKTGETFKPGSRHTLIVREYDKKGGITVDTVRVTADTIRILIAEPVKGHTIAVDKSFRDWKGTAPGQENTATVSEGEYIWKDAADDDTGNGWYQYPTHKALKKGCDLKEFRITFDKENLYFLIKCDRPGEFWAPYRIIGIDTDGAKGGKNGMQVLTQGAPEDLTSDSGCYGEIKVSPELACDYVIGIFNSFKGRIWDAKGKLLARKEGSKTDDTAGFKVDDVSWSAVEVAIPWSILGGFPAGQTWRFVVGIGQQDKDIFREIEKEVSEWHGGGGEHSDDFGPDPDVFDLASPDKKTQEFELRSYNAEGETGDPASFATINRSYLTVTFAE